MRSASASRGGFSLPELLVVVALGALLVVALQQAMITQRRWGEAQRDAALRHESARVAMAVLSWALREANVPNGDAVIVAAGGMRIRMPLGAGVACGADSAGTYLGLAVVEGRWEAGPGDSVLVWRATGWTAERVAAVEAPGPLVPCVPPGGRIVRLGRPVAGLAGGAGVRAFRSHVLELRSVDGEAWLVRSDGARTDPLVGPLAPGGVEAWYEDALGGRVAGPAAAVRVGVRVVAVGRSPGAARADTVVLTFGGRNR